MLDTLLTPSGTYMDYGYFNLPLMKTTGTLDTLPPLVITGTLDTSIDIYW